MLRELRTPRYYFLFTESSEFYAVICFGARVCFFAGEFAFVFLQRLSLSFSLLFSRSAKWYLRLDFAMLFLLSCSFFV